MRIFRKLLSLVISISIYLTLFLPIPAVKAQDLVATDSLTGGSSVFVFHGSRKKPQAHAAAGRARGGESAGRSMGSRAASL